MTTSDTTASDVGAGSKAAGHRPLGPTEYARFIDHTLLRPEATRAEVADALADAVELGVHSVCVAPVHLPLDVPLRPDGTKAVKVTTVVGFPSGAHKTSVKVAEATQAVADGADELDMVVNLTDVKNGDYASVKNEISDLKRIAGDHILKVIIETCYLTDDEKIELCHAITDAGADYIKTSTGFGTAGATMEDVRLFRENIGPGVKIKAAGGIRTREDMEAYIEAGCSRLGTSSAISILAEGVAQGY